MKFKKTLFILCILICLFAMANVSAGDANDTNLTSLNAQIDDLNIDSVENGILQSDMDSKEILKTPKTIVVNNSNVDDIFNGENDTLGDSVNEGDTLDFNGTIDKNRNLVINKPVNIISTSKKCCD